MASFADWEIGTVGEMEWVLVEKGIAVVRAVA